MKGYKQLTYYEMIKIETLLEEGLNPAEIAVKIEKNKTTVYRCIKNNSDKGFFHADKVWKKIKERQSRANIHRRILSDSILEKYIIKKIEAYWSPEQIAGRWKKATGEALSHETIYKYIYQRKPDLVQLYLRRKGIHYHNRRSGQGKIPEMRVIDERPRVVEERKEIGHWEGDVIVDKSLVRGIVTNVERKSGFLIASKIDKKTAQTVCDVTIEDFADLPDELKLSITYDRGSEFSLHKIIESMTKMTVYFAHAYAPWERGSNENTNGLLRQFIPRGTDFNEVGENDLQYYVSLLNNRPRKRLNYQTPYEVLQEELKSCT